ncbi:MAG: glycogen debranching protein GlgX [Acidobacteriota bacterium]|nr:glycogen debranching protein GlgX [Acidobacteriota bacterium]
MSSRPLGATLKDGGVDFRVFSAHAESIDLCLYPPSGEAGAATRLAMKPGEDGVWHRRVPQVGPGQLYAYRADGPRATPSGHHFNPSKLLLDPYARAVAGEVVWDKALLVSNDLDSETSIPRCVVCDPSFDWGDDSPPRTSWSDTLIYECHVRGLTRLHPRVPAELRGTYLALAEDPITEHLRRLGVTAIELMPVQHFATERHLAERGLSNYWGYNPVSFFAPHSGYASGHFGQQVTEFKAMVRGLHRAGLEVILDVVFNHTGEGGVDGPTSSLRGLDNTTYYRLRPQDPSRYLDFSGCGNTLDLGDPIARRLVLDSLRFWVEEMRVDGFRFDLATTLGRGETDFSRGAPLFESIATDPVLAQVKLIAEPWDLGPGGYQAGDFPEGWREWNDRYRDTTRRFWRGDAGQVGDFATRLTGSSDLYDGRRSARHTGINYVTCHDGFTLHDLVSYRNKRNEANLEGNRDGRRENLSSNWGVEGPSTAPSVLGARQTAKKNMLATLALSSGVPMLGHGDEMGRTQLGNNNAYCQDSVVSWIDWQLDAQHRELLDFTREVFQLRRRLVFLRHPGFFSPSEVVWLSADGNPLSPTDWRLAERRELGMLIQGDPQSPCERILILFNARARLVEFRLPEIVCDHSWMRLLTTATSDAPLLARQEASLPAYSLAVFACGESEVSSFVDRSGD